MSVFLIASTYYDGGEWIEWQLEDLVFSTQEKAEEWIHKNQPYSRCEIKEVPLL